MMSLWWQSSREGLPVTMNEDMYLLVGGLLGIGHALQPKHALTRAVRSGFLTSPSLLHEVSAALEISQAVALIVSHRDHHELQGTLGSQRRSRRPQMNLIGTDSTDLVRWETFRW